MFCSSDAKKWAEWADKQLAVLLFPNLTRNFSESYQVGRVCVPETTACQSVRVRASVCARENLLEHIRKGKYRVWGGVVGVHWCAVLLVGRGLFVPPPSQATQLAGSGASRSLPIFFPSVVYQVVEGGSGGHGCFWCSVAGLVQVGCFASRKLRPQPGNSPRSSHSVRGFLALRDERSGVCMSCCVAGVISCRREPRDYGSRRVRPFHETASARQKLQQLYMVCRRSMVRPSVFFRSRRRR